MVHDLINALDVGFYASAWNNQLSAMTVSRINFYIPEDDGKLVHFTDYEDLTDVMETEVKGDHKLLSSSTACWAAVGIVMLTIKGGVNRDDGLLTLTQFINPQTITFNNIIENGANNTDGEILMLDEGPIYKEINSTAINKFLGDRFVDSDGNVPTCEGLRQIVNAKGKLTEGTEGYATLHALYNTLYATFEEKGIMEKDVDLTSIPLVGSRIGIVNVTIELINVFKALIKSPDDLATKLQNMRVEIDITTCPHHSNKETGYGTKALPIPLDKIEGDKNPLIVWGLDVYGPNSSTPVVSQ